MKCARFSEEKRKFHSRLLFDGVLVEVGRKGQDFRLGRMIAWAQSKRNHPAKSLSQENIQCRWHINGHFCETSLCRAEMSRMSSNTGIRAGPRGWNQLVHELGMAEGRKTQGSSPANTRQEPCLASSSLSLQAPFGYTLHFTAQKMKPEVEPCAAQVALAPLCKHMSWPSATHRWVMERPGVPAALKVKP